MSIIDSINKARQKGVSDEKILEEIIKQNPDKKGALGEALKRGAKHSNILEEIVKQNSAKQKIQEEDKKKKAQELIMEKLKKKKPEQDPSPEEDEQELPPKKTATDKQWKRLVVFLLLIVAVLGFATFWFWFLIIRPQPPVPPEVKEAAELFTQKECEQAGYYWYDEACHEQEQKLEAVDYFTQEECEQAGYYWYYRSCHEQELIITLEQANDLISSALMQEIPKGEFQELIFEIEREEIDFIKIIQGLEIDFPELFNKLQDPIFFAYSQEQGNMIGFYGEIEEDISELMKEKEEDLLDIFANLFKAIEEQELIAGEFEETLGEFSYRYQELNEEGLGIFYYISDNDFIFSTSKESMEKLIQDIVIVEKEQIIISTMNEIAEIIEQIFEEEESYVTICQEEEITEKINNIAEKTGETTVCVALQDRYCLATPSFFEENDYCLDVTGKVGHVGPCINYYCSN